MLKKRIRTGIKVLLVFVLAWSSYHIYRYYHDQKTFQELNNSYHLQMEMEINNLIKRKKPLKKEDREEQKKETKDDIKPKEKRPTDPQWSFAFVQTLQQSYPDIRGRLIIESVGIDFPIVQGQDNTFYLDHTFQGTPHPFGAIFMDVGNSSDFSDFNTVVYGHNVSTGQVFHSLKYFKNDQFVKTHPYIIVDTPDQRLTYQIFAVYEAEADDDYRSPFYGDQDLEDFWSYIQDHNLIEGPLPSETDRILTLSTCTDQEKRLVVQAILLQ